jgi:proline dehydrogenase
MLSLSNTQLAFALLSNRELNRAKLLFLTLSFPFLVKAGLYLIKLAIRIKLPILWAVKPTIFKQFVGGETLVECLPVVDKLDKYNVKSILDFSVEGQNTETSHESAFNEILRSIGNAKGNKAIPFTVFKPSGLVSINILEKVSRNEALSPSEKQIYSLFCERIETLCIAAANADTPLLMDAEDSWYQKALDDICHEMMQKYNRGKAFVYNTLQMYRKDRLEFLQQSLKIAVENNYIFGAKLVRGAYMEKERDRAQWLGYTSPIHDTKTQTDMAFNGALEFLLINIDHTSIFCGTHNEESVYYLISLMDRYAINPNDTRVFFSQLYGMSDHITFNLAHSGYNVAKYIPYGPVKLVIPYLMRRAQENTSVEGQTGRELLLIRQEQERRKKMSIFKK